MLLYIDHQRYRKPDVSFLQPQPQHEVKRVLLITLVLNLLVAVGKIVLGTLTGILAITADGFHSLADGAGNVVGLIATHFAHSPADADHPYGHRRIETVATLMIGIALLFTVWELLNGLIARLSQPEAAPMMTPGAVLVLLGTLAVNLFVSRYQMREGNRLRSEILLADAKNTRADVYVTGMVLLTACFVGWGWLWADVVAVTIVMLLIAHAAWDILRHSGQVLVDKAPYTAQQITDALPPLPAIERIARVRSRGPQDAAHIDIDLLVPPQMTVAETNAIKQRIETHLNANLHGLTEVEVHFAAATVKQTVAISLVESAN